MRLHVIDNDMVSAYRRALIGDIVAKNRFKRKFIAQAEGRFATRFTSSDGLVCVKDIKLKTGSYSYNDELMDLLNVQKSGDLVNKKVYPVWIYFTPKLKPSDIGAAEMTAIETRVRELVDRYSIDSIIVRFTRSNIYADMEPSGWEFGFSMSYVSAQDIAQVRLIGEVMYLMHRIWKGGNCTRFYDDPYSLGEPVCTMGSYTAKMSAEDIVRAVKESIGAKNSDIYGECDLLDFSCQEKINKLPPISPGLEFAYMVIYGVESGIWRRDSKGETGVSIEGLKQMTSREFVEFFRQHVATDFVYHKSTWEKVKNFLIGLVIVVTVVMGLYHISIAIQQAMIAYSTAVAAGAAFTAAAWEGITTFFIMMAPTGLVETLGTDWVSVTYAVGALETYNAMNMIASLGVSTDYAVQTLTPQDAEEAVDMVFSGTDYMVDAMMPDAWMRRQFAQLEI